MPAITFKELKQNWDDGIEDERYTINYYVNIDDSVKIEPYTIIEPNVKIGKNSIIGPFTQLRSNVTIGENCHIGGHCTFESKDGYEIIIGNNCRIGSHCNLPYNVVIEDDVFFGNGTTISNDKHIQWPLSGNFEPEFSRVCKGAKIGINCTLIGPIIIGTNSIIGAGSVVTHSVIQGTTVYGNPARDVKKEKEERNKMIKEMNETIRKCEHQLGLPPMKLDLPPMKRD